MTRAQHSRLDINMEDTRPSDRRVADYLETALLVAHDGYEIWRGNRYMDVPALVARRFCGAFPPDTTVEQILRAIDARSQTLLPALASDDKREAAHG